jgi:hypothetical protein
LWQRRYEHMCISCPCTLPVRRLSVLTVGLGGAHSASSCEAGVLRLQGEGWRSCRPRHAPSNKHLLGRAGLRTHHGTLEQTQAAIRVSA